VVKFQEQLRAHLDTFATAPFLFVGSGFSRRYAQSEDWAGLLRELAAPIGKPYERYVSSANGSLPKIASLIAEDFHDLWWERDEYADHRVRYPSPKTISSPLKVEIAIRFERLVGRLPDDGPLNIELEALRDAVIEGVITTNYDGILEYVFPDFATYVGQDELLFKDPYGVAEIYKIHGSYADPESLVITQEDFERFNERNVYLAAKLLTVFIEHPVIFVGYSLNDENVQQIIQSIASILTNENLDQLKDRLIFVDWQPGIKVPTLVHSNFSIGSQSIPVHLATVANYLELFQVLGGLKRRFPARVLRHLKEQVYELVRTSEVGKTVYVTDLESDTDIKQVDVVIGVGVNRRLESHGIVGLTRRDLIEDVLNPKIPKDKHAEIVEKVLPVLTRGGTSHVPIYRYLRGAALIDGEGSVLPEAKIAPAIRARVRLGTGPLELAADYYKRRVAGLLEKYPTLADLTSRASLSEALLAIPSLNPEAVDGAALRDFLIANGSVLDTGKTWDVTQWIKCVCFYDLVANRKKPKPRQRRPAVP
jgi:SIR2-like domain